MPKSKKPVEKSPLRDQNPFRSTPLGLPVPPVQSIDANQNGPEEH